MARTAGRTLCWFLIQLQNIRLQSLGMCRKQNFKIVFGFNMTQLLSVDLYFCLSLLPSFFAFLASFFFFCWAFSRLYIVAKSFLKAFWILHVGLDERKGRWVVEQDFHGNSQVNRCGYIRHFYRSKWSFTMIPFVWWMWLNFPASNLPWKKSTVTPNRRTKLPVTFNVVNS